MSLVEIILLAISLSLDCCAVALASTAAGHLADRRSAIRLSFHFGLFQFLMPVIGWGAGSRAQPYIESYDHWIAFGLLAFVGIRMIRAARDPELGQSCDPSRGWTLVSLSTATSIDALAVGLGLAALRIQVWYPAAIIGLVATLSSGLAIAGGARLGPLFGRRAQLAGGILLLGIGLRIVISHML